MNSIVKGQWLEALKTYPKTRKALKKEEGMCCLGVLCDISNQGKWRKKDSIWLFLAKDVYNDQLSFGGLVEKVQKWSGVDDEVGYFRYVGNHGNVITSSLAEVNDCTDDFTQVIDLIIRFF